MNNFVNIALRNLGRQTKRTVLLGSAIAFGFLIITLVNSFTAGLALSAQDNFSHAFGGHIYFTGTQVSDRGSEISVIQDTRVVDAALDILKDQVSSVHRRSQTTGSLIVGAKVQRQKVEGVNFQDEKDFRQNLQVASGSLDNLDDPRSIILSQEAADKLGVKIGEALIFKTPTVSGQQNLGDFILVATYTGQSGFGMSSAFASLETVNQLIGLEKGQFQSVNVYLKDMNSIDQATLTAYNFLKTQGPVASREKDPNEDTMMSSMRSMMGGTGPRALAEDDRWVGTKYQITNLNDIMASLLMIIQTINAIGFSVFIILLIITMVGIMNSYRMVMVERTGEIGTMRALGVQKSGIRDIFLWEGFFIALGGALAGLTLALLVVFFTGLVDFGSSSFLSFFMKKGHINFHLNPGEILKNLGILVALSMVAVFWPARSASELEPAQALREVY